MFLKRFRNIHLKALFLCLSVFTLAAPTANAQSEAQIRRQAESLIESGKSDIRSGEWLLNQRQSAMDPNRDVRRLHEQGRSMVEQGKKKISEGEALLARINEQRETERAEQARADALIPRQYFLPLERNRWTNNFENQSSDLLRHLYSSGIRRRASIAFEGVFLYDQFLYRKLDNPTQEMTRTLKRIDGSQYSVISNTRYNLDANRERTRLTPGNESIRAGDIRAIVYAEIIYHRHYNEAVISYRAVNPNTWAILYSHIEIVPVNDEFIAATGVTPPDENAQPLPDTIAFADQNTFLHRVAGTEGLTFAIRYEGEPLTYMSRALPTLYKHTLSTHTELTVLDSDFISRAIPHASEESRAHFESTHTTEFRIKTSDESSFTLEVVDLNSNRSVAMGDVEFDVEIPDEAEEVASR